MKEISSKAARDRQLKKLEKALKKEWERIRDKNYYQVFGITRKGFDREKIKKKYFEMLNLYGPDNFFKSSSEMLDLAESFLYKVTSAFTTLSSGLARQIYDELPAPFKRVKGSEEKEEKLRGQIHYRSGMTFLAMNDYDNAVKSFTECVHSCPDNPEYYACLAMAIYNNPCNKGLASAVKRAKELINQSLSLGKLATAYLARGEILYDEGNFSLAEVEFSKALAIDPENKNAIKKLEIIKKNSRERKTGFLGRISGRWAKQLG